MPRRDPVSIFYGPHRRFDDLAAWPPTIQLHLQLHGLQPGDLTTPPLDPQLFDPHVLTPTVTPGHWRIVVRPISFLLIHTATERSLTVRLRNPLERFFFFTVPFAIDRWAYNLLLEPAGNLAFNGTATFSWKEP